MSLFFWCFWNPPTLIFNERDLSRQLLQDKKKEFIRKGFLSAACNGIRYTCASYWENHISILRQYDVPAAKRKGADFLEVVSPKNAEVVSGRIKFETAANSVVGQTLRKQLNGWNRKWTGAKSGKGLASRRQASRVIPTKIAKQTSRWRWGI